MGSIGLKVKQTETSVCIHNQQQLQSKKKERKILQAQQNCFDNYEGVRPREVQIQLLE